MIVAVLHNVVEAVHRQFRKITKQRSIFPNDDGGGTGQNFSGFSALLAGQISYDEVYLLQGFHFGIWRSAQSSDSAHYTWA